MLLPGENLDDLLVLILRQIMLRDEVFSDDLSLRALFTPTLKRMPKNSVCTPEFHWSARLKQQEHTTQDAQKGRTSHPPNPGGYFTLPP